MKTWFAIASLAVFTTAGCASKTIAPKVVLPPDSPAASVSRGVTIFYRTVGSHQTLIMAERPLPATLVSMSLLGANGNLDFAEVEQREPSIRWQLTLNTAPEDVDILTLVFKDENGDIITARLSPNR